MLCIPKRDYIYIMYFMLWSDQYCVVLYHIPWYLTCIKWLVIMWRETKFLFPSSNYLFLLFQSTFFSQGIIIFLGSIGHDAGQRRPFLVVQCYLPYCIYIDAKLLAPYLEPRQSFLLFVTLFVYIYIHMKIYKYYL